jgi:hypothetical protein
MAFKEALFPRSSAGRIAEGGKGVSILGTIPGPLGAENHHVKIAVLIIRPWITYHFDKSFVKPGASGNSAKL